jgi:ABC-type transporter MlaC component
MRINKTLMGVALACSAMLLSSAAMAQGETYATCSHLADQVATALNSNTDSPNYREAKVDADNGHVACASNNYEMGVSYYQKALDLLAHK